MLFRMTFVYEENETVCVKRERLFHNIDVRRSERKLITILEFDYFTYTLMPLNLTRRHGVSCTWYASQEYTQYRRVSKRKLHFIPNTKSRPVNTYIDNTTHPATQVLNVTRLVFRMTSINITYYVIAYNVFRIDLFVLFCYTNQNR